MYKKEEEVWWWKKKNAELGESHLPQTQDCPEFITPISLIAHLSELGCAQHSPLNEWREKKQKRNTGIDGRVMGTTADGNTWWVGGTSAATQDKSISAGRNEAGRAEGVKWQVGADAEPESVTPASRY